MFALFIIGPVELGVLAMVLAWLLWRLCFRAGLVRGPAILGAVLAHPALFLVAFTLGATLGSPPAMGPPGTESGMAGGYNAIEVVVVGYIMTFGIGPLLVSALGAGIGVGAHHVLRMLLTSGHLRRETEPTEGLVGRANAAEDGAVEVPPKRRDQN
jgi:hypothetical protein